MQVVVDLPRAVGDDEVDRLPRGQIVEDHEVDEQHFIHAAPGVEAGRPIVRIVFRGCCQARELIARRMDRLTALFQQLPDRGGNQPVDSKAGPEGAERICDRHVSPGGMEAGAGRDEEHAPRTAKRAGPARHLRGRWENRLNELSDEKVEPDGIAVP